jgi:hypothetical protein
VEGLNLSAVCGVAFSTVVVILALLAFVIHLITLAFPAPFARTDPAIVVAIAAAVASCHPGARVIGIEEAP